MNVTVEDATPAPVTVVLNWDAELKIRASTLATALAIALCFGE